jgi:CheY-like chemotaxis protein
MSPVGQPLVAVVDDDPRIRELLASELEELRAEVLRCGSGIELLEHPRLADVQLVLLDWMLPERDGRQILDALGQQGFSGRVVVVSALCDPEMRRQAIAGGAAAILLKTEALEHLPQLLSRV